MADSREEKIIKSMLGEQVELEPPQSRIEVLLYELKDAIEQGGGGGGGVFYVDIETDENTGIRTLNKTYQEIYNAYTQGKVVKCRQAYDDLYFEFNDLNAIGLGEDEVTYGVSFNNTFTCSSVSDYPTYSDGDAIVL